MANSPVRRAHPRVPDWSRIREALTAGARPGTLARQHGIHHFAILNRARREGWLPPPSGVASVDAALPTPAAVVRPCRQAAARRRARAPLEARLLRVLDVALARIETALAEGGADALAEPRTLTRLDAILKLYPRLREAARHDTASPADPDRTSAHDLSLAEPAPGVDDLLGKFDRLRAAGELEIRARLADGGRAAGA